MQTYPIAEIFKSVQGEGYNSGLAMIFVRLAGCTVGKPYTTGQREKFELHIFQNECTIWDGRKFACDTDYRLHRRMTTEEIINEVKAFGDYQWISITGGEPLMHDIQELVNGLDDYGYHLHLETSGTIPMTSRIEETLRFFHHVVISPKHPFLDDYISWGNEFRLLVDDQFDWQKLPQALQEELDEGRGWISPVNFADTIDVENAKRCIAIQEQHPNVRISLQIHKLLGAR
jgi:organic radical activating enzyme